MALEDDARMLSDMIGGAKSPGSTVTKNARVVSVEGKTAWVSVIGGASRTPCSMAVSCKAGDSVVVTFSDGSATVTGNTSSPATDDTAANVASVQSDEAMEAASQSYNMANEARNMAGDASADAAGAMKDAETALGTAMKAETLAKAVTVVTRFYTVTESSTAPERPKDTSGWSSTPLSFSDYHDASHWQWETTRTATGDGTVTFTDPVLEPAFENDKAAWLSAFADEQVWVQKVRGSAPSQSDAWSTTMPELVSGNQMWSATRRTMNSGASEVILIVPYSGAVSTSLWFYQTVSPSPVPPAPVSYDPGDGWALTPPAVGVDSASGNSTVAASTRTQFGDGSFTWSEPSGNAYASTIVNNVYELQSIKSDYASKSSLTQQADRITAEVSARATTDSNVTALGTRVTQTESDISSEVSARQTTDGNVTALTSRVTQTESNVTTLFSQEIGGTNLARNSNAGWSSTEYNVILGTMAEPWVVGEKYSVSLKGTIDSSGIFGIWSDDGSVFIGEPVSKGNGIFALEGAECLGSADTSHYSVWNMPGTHTGSATVEWIKIERGSKATDWSPAPEDKADQTALATAQATADTANGTANTLSTLIRDSSAGTLVAKVGQAVGALVNADGSFDVVEITWDGTTPTVGATLMTSDSDGTDINIVASDGTVSTAAHFGTYMTLGRRSNESACGNGSIAIGNDVIASGAYSFACGQPNYHYSIQGDSGSSTESTKDDLKASGLYSFASGLGNRASGTSSFAIGATTSADGDGSSSEGRGTSASGIYAHAEGIYTSASGAGTHAEGADTRASGRCAHAEGVGTTANHASQHVSGEYNISDPSTGASTDRGTYIDITGNGTSDSARSNARTLDWSGNEWIAGAYSCGDAATTRKNLGLDNHVTGTTLYI